MRHGNDCVPSAVHHERRHGQLAQRAPGIGRHPLPEDLEDRRRRAEGADVLAVPGREPLVAFAARHVDRDLARRSPQPVHVVDELTEEFPVEADLVVVVDGGTRGGVVQDELAHPVSAERPRIGIQQKLRRIAAQSAGRIVGPGGPVPVRLARPIPGTKACQTPASWSRSGICVSAPFSSNRHSIIPSATLEATAKFVPPSRTVAPSGNRLPGSGLAACPAAAVMAAPSGRRRGSHRRQKRRADADGARPCDASPPGRGFARSYAPRSHCDGERRAGRVRAS